MTWCSCLWQNNSEMFWTSLVSGGTCQWDQSLDTFLVPQWFLSWRTSQLQMLRPLVAQDQCLDQDNLQWQNCLHAGKTDQFSSGSFSCLPGLFLLWLYLHLSITSDALGALWFLCKTIGSSEAGCKIRTIGISLAPPRFWDSWQLLSVQYFMQCDPYTVECGGCLSSFWYETVCVIDFEMRECRESIIVRLLYWKYKKQVW